MTTQRIGPYRIERELGRGGQAVVYLAVDTRLGRQCALKILSPGASSVARRLQREAESAGRLDHPGICTVYESGVHRGTPYIAMRFIEGETLSSRITRDATIAPDEAAAIVERVAIATHAAHEAGVIHRDLNPRNIMIDNDGEPIILDFGLAADERVTVSARTDGFGTPAYLAPEQIREDGGRPDRRTDVWALGATLFETLTGEQPFIAPTRERLYRSILDDSCPDLRNVRAGVPRDLAVVVQTALSKEQDRRYQTAADLAEDLRRIRVSESINARPTGPLLRLRLWSRRNPAIAASLAGLVTILAVGVVATGTLLASSRETLAAEQRLHDIRAWPEIEREFHEKSWPALPEGVGPMLRWLGEAEALATRGEVHRRHLQLYRAESSGELDDLAALANELPSLERMIASVRARIEDARYIEARTVDAWHDEWTATIDAIADEALNPRYGGLRLDPQVGLVPLGKDPTSDLFEFAHPQSGEVPTRDPATGLLSITGKSGLVFVLVPPGAFDMGAERPTPQRPVGSPNVDPGAMTFERPEQPVHRVELDAFFISKYEMTAGQWDHVSIADAAETGIVAACLATDPRQPVYGLQWETGRRVLSRLGLALPTEAQWEYAARAGTTTVWWCGDDPEIARWTCNAGMMVGKQLVARNKAMQPVGTYPANGFGLHEVMGNVSELVREWLGSYELPVRPGDGERQTPRATQRMSRGAAFKGTGIGVARSAARNNATLAGVRPSRAILAGPSLDQRTPEDSRRPAVSTAVAAPSPLHDISVHGPASLRIDPRATFLHSSWSDDVIVPAESLALADLGIAAGDRIRLECLGDFTGNRHPFALVAVFSVGDRLAEPRLHHRVPGAIDAGDDFRSPTTAFEGEPTDIAEDFAVRDKTSNGVSVVVPPDATHLFIGMSERRLEDNIDADGDFGVRISVATPDEPSRDALPQPAHAGVHSVKIKPAASFLRVAYPEDAPYPAWCVSLARHGFGPGDSIRLRRMGDWSAGADDDAHLALIAVFGSDETILPDARRHRIPAAIDAGDDVITPPTRFGSMETDIPEDFAIADEAGTFDSVVVVVPEGATSLWICVVDDYYRDNHDPDGDLEVEITKIEGARP